MRWKERLRIRATVLTSKVLASPGTPTRSTCPREQAGQQLLNNVVLANDHRADLPAERAVTFGQGGDRRDLVSGRFGKGGKGRRGPAAVLGPAQARGWD